MLRRFIVVVFLFLLAVGCVPQSSPSPNVVEQPVQAGSGEASADYPDVGVAARAYLDAWKMGDYFAMYQMLTALSRDAMTAQEFLDHYQSVASEAELSGIDYDILSSLANQETAQVGYRVTLHSTLVGDIQADALMNLSLEDGEWRVQWDDTLILPQLNGDHFLYMIREGYTPSRANIYDRYGQALVAYADTTAVGLYPDQILPEQLETLLSGLSEILGMRVESIQALIDQAPPGAGWYVPLGEVPAELVSANLDFLSSLNGLVLKPYKARYYFGGGVAPHVLGYVSSIPAEEVEEYRLKGYSPDERVGRNGIEQWGEMYLAGKRGGALYVYDGQGNPVTRLAESQPEPAQAIYTTLDRDFQLAAQQALSGFRGAIVVLERDTGRVLAMVSSPGFDPNAFEPINFNSDALTATLESLDRPLLNRATQGQYPLGSVFKIITMASALESGLYSPASTLYCGHTFEELPGTILYDWTYEYDFPPSGLLTLPGGLIRSCNPWFYHIGLDFYNQGISGQISEMARGFGLGQATGIQGVDEAAGQVPDPIDPIDATNLAIGQGSLLVTPLQVANFTAAIANGGTLYIPQVIEAIKPVNGPPSYLFEPQVNGSLPIDPATLQEIQQAMVGVVNSTKPRGTAYHVFTGLDIPVAGKTGTAQSGVGAPHAWFAGYTFAEQADKPDIAAVVVVENVGEGSDYAAPIFRRIVELYFFNSPGKLYDWESTYNVTATPSPQSTPAP